MRISDWSSDVCSSDLQNGFDTVFSRGGVLRQHDCHGFADVPDAFACQHRLQASLHRFDRHDPHRNDGNLPLEVGGREGCNYAVDGEGRADVEALYRPAGDGAAPSSEVQLALRYAVGGACSFTSTPPVLIR